MADKPNDIETIYNTARQKLSGAERSAYLDNACGNDAALRARVEALLKADDQAGSFLDAPALDVTVTFDKSPLTEGPGTVIGPYKLLEKIGEGGMAYVYMAEQERPLRRRVALKIIKLGMDTKQVIARFEVERQALAVMDHPNIAKVFDAGATETGRPYFVMELVKGVSITEYCDKNKLSTPERLGLFIQVCNAVQHAHQKGIIHRDIKPSNVMVTLHDGKPVPKVIDFGIAKATIQRLTEKTLFTKYAQMIGTPEYMSPEQAEMSGLDIDTRADIYSLGVLLYELLTGTTPFDAEDLRSKGYGEMQRIIRETEPLKPSTKLSTMGDALTGVAEHRKTNPDLLAKLVRGDLDWIVMKTLEKDRTRRYETVSSLAADVKRHLNEEPVEAGPPGATYRIGKLIRKHRRTVAAVITIAATLIIGLVISSTMYFVANRARQAEGVARKQAEQAEKVAQDQRTLAEQQRKLAEEKSESLRRTLYVNSIQLADASYHEGNISRVRQLLDSSPEDLRGWEWDRLNHIMDQSSMTFLGHQNEIYCLALSPDAKQLASGDSDGILKLWNWKTGVELATLRGHTGFLFSIAFSPDGKRVASCGSDQMIKIWDISKGEELITLRGHQSWVRSVMFSPDGKLLASGGDDRMIKIWDVSKGEEAMMVGGQQGGSFSVAFSPDGKRIASGNGVQTVTIWDANSGEKLITLSGHKGYVTSVGFSPDGKHIVSGSYDGTVKLWNAATGEELMTLRGHTNSVNSVAYDQNGKRIVSASFDNTIKIWDPASGEELMTLRGHCDAVNSVVFSPDGRMVISGSSDKTLKVWDIGTCREQIAMQISRDTTVHCIAFSPDGRRIVSTGTDATIKEWDVSNGEELRTLYGHEGPVFKFSFSPDGKRIVSGSWDRTVKVWDSITGKELMTFRGHDANIDAVAFSPDGRRIVSTSWDKRIIIWDATTGAEVMKLPGHKDWAVSVVYSPDGSRIISGGRDGTIKAWDAKTGVEFMTLQGHKGSVNQIAFSPDGKRIVSCGGDVIKVWDAETVIELMRLSGHVGGVCSISFSPDGKRLISSSSYGEVKVWDFATGAELMRITAAPSVAVYSVAISPCGRSIVAAGYGGIVLWETAKPAGGYEPRKNGEAARKVVEEVYQKYGFYYEVIDKIQRDKTLDEPVRRVALQIANSRRWEDTEKPARKVVDELYKKYGYYYQVVDDLRSDAALEASVREIALQIASAREWEDADKLNGESWDVARSPDSDANAYRQALNKAEKAVSLEPNDLNILNTLGVAQYRFGDYENALGALTRCEKRRTDKHLEPAPENMAFVAMSLHKLDRKDEAKVALEQLRALCKEERFAEDQEAQAFLTEAEQLITGEKQ